MLEKLVRVGILFDFYGPLLTEKQRRIVELYYNNDLSLGEIAAEYGISRQAVYDILQRTVKILEKYEKKLGLVEKYQQERLKLEAGIAALDAVLEGKDLTGATSREKLAGVRETLLALLAD